MTELKVGSCKTFPYLVVILSCCLFFLDVQWSFAQKSAPKFIHVKFKEKSIPVLVGTGRSARTGVSRVDKVIEKYKPSNIRRIFPEAGVFEAAHREFGLHLWYEIELEGDSGARTAVKDYQATGDFDHVELSRPYSLVEDVRSYDRPEAAPALLTGTNDPGFSQQWHFSNSGQTGGTPGADINLLKAWQKETGSPNVIVAIIDGGIDASHPDLKDAMWVNADEVPANGIDDDRNGYVDDVHGYSFGDHSPIIYADDHATHVAGTIGAVTNNGIGVAGIAGGDGSGNGVRLMSCATFGNFNVGGFAEAMVYAADNGAVISQNSWGGGSSAIEAAIDYFISRAGYDNRAEVFSQKLQTGPMAGGVVIFAAGNANTSDTYYGYPGSYPKVIAVGASDHKDVKAPFSNFGTWLEIFAPGDNVYSTKKAGYGFFSGTSMACPHVSGVAALIVSNLQRQGMTPNEVWSRLRSSARSINSNNPTFVGQLGWGRLDAQVALREPDFIAPGAIADLRAEDIHSTSLELIWTASGEDFNEGQAAEYEIRFSTSPITQFNFTNAMLVADPPTPPASGETVKIVVKDLTPATTHYFAVICKDVFNNVSPLSNILSVTTLRLPTPELVTLQVSEQIYTGRTSTRNIVVKNIGDEDELLVRIGAPRLQPAPVLPPLGAKGRLFGVNSSKNTFDEIDPKTGQVIRSIPMPEPSSKVTEGLAFDGKHLYFGRSSTVYKIEPETGKVVRSFKLANTTYITGLAWSGKYLYVSQQQRDFRFGIAEVDTDNGLIRRTFDGYGELAFLGRKGTLLASYYSRLTEINIETGLVIKEQPTNDGGLGYSFVDDLIFISQPQSSTIKAMNPSTGEVAYTIPYFRATALAADETGPAWLDTNEKIISILPGMTGEIPVTFNSAGLTTSTLTGTVNVIPINSSGVLLPVQLALTTMAGTDIETATEIDFGTEYANFPIDTTVAIENRGSSSLIVNQIQSNDIRVSTSISSATILPGQRIDLQITVNPSTIGVVDAQISLSSNDPDEGNFLIPVRALILEAPAISIATDSLKVELKAGELKSRTLDLKNSGGSTLHWDVDLSGTESEKVSQSNFPKMVSVDRQDSIYKSELGEITLKSPSPEPVTGLAYDPDGEVIYAKAYLTNNFYSYDLMTDTWKLVGLVPNSFEGQATYLNGKIFFGGPLLNVYTIKSGSWSSIPFPIQGDAVAVTNDNKFVYTAIGKRLFRFDPLSLSWMELAPNPGPSYMIKVGSLSYHSGVLYATGFYNITADERILFFKYFIDKNSWIQSPSASGKAFVGSAIDLSSARFFITGGYQPETGIRLSVLDIRTGEWTVQALPFSVSNINGSVFVGKPGVSGIYFIQGASGNKFGYIETPAAPEWYTLSPRGGSISPGETQTITIDVNAETLFGGIYQGNIRVYSAHPKLEKVIPLKVSVSGVPELLLKQTNVNMGTIVLGATGARQVRMTNVGSAELVVTNISTDSPDFTVSNSSFTLPVGESAYVTLYYNPTTTGSKTGTLVFHSNDPLKSETSINVVGTTVLPSQLLVPTDTLKANLRSGQIVKRRFSVENLSSDSTQRLAIWSRGYWIRVANVTNIGGNSKREFDVEISAVGMTTGRYRDSIRVADERDPSQVAYFVPVLMDVTSAPNISFNFDSLDYQERFVNRQYDSILKIKNTGVLPLLINSIISESDDFTTSTSFPVTVDAGKVIDAPIHFRPSAVGPKRGKIIFSTNDPDGNLTEYLVKGEGVEPPSLSLSETGLFVTAFAGESNSTLVEFSNSGGSVLKWKAISDSSPENAETDVFIRMASIPKEYNIPQVLTSLAVTQAGLLYAQHLSGQELYAYNPTSNAWVYVDNTPSISNQNSVGGSVILNSKIYSVYNHDRTTLHIYDMILREWTERPNGLALGSANITTDSNLLYISGEGMFGSYHPKKNVWTKLPTPNFALDGLGGLSFLDGAIYAHSSNGSSFARYIIATGFWETLLSIPGKVTLGSTVDPVRKRYYAYGENFLYEYDVTAGIWTTRFIPFFKIAKNGGISFVSRSGQEGIYFIQGESGAGFAKYQPEDSLSWLRTSQILGHLEPMGKQFVGINCNARDLNPGVYKGAIRVTANDPEKLNSDIPVTFTVLNPDPTITVTASVTDSVSRTAPTIKYIIVENKGKYLLEWNLQNQLPSWLTVDKVSGSVSGQRKDSVKITFLPIAFIGGVASFTLTFRSNDQAHPEVLTSLLFTKQNHPPVNSKLIEDQILNSNQIQILLTDHFSDPDGDQLDYLVQSSPTTVVNARLFETTLLIEPLNTGFATVTISAKDAYLSTVSSEFIVNNIVTSIQDAPTDQVIIANPNPFESKFIIRSKNFDFTNGSIVFFDAMGRDVSDLVELENIFMNEVELEGSKLPTGIYLCVLKMDNAIVRSIKLLKK